MPQTMKLLVGAVSAATAAATGEADLHLLNDTRYPNARCLDGSPGGFYFRQASAVENATKWVFSLEGGGECVTQADCDGRKKSSLGSSTFFKPTQYLGQLQDPNEQYNPDFSTWNAVFVKYCTGDLHMGQQTAQGQSLSGLQFSGHHVLDGVLSTLATAGDLVKADTIVWSGDSAGGLGATDSVDWVLDWMRNATKATGGGDWAGTVYGVPIGGFYFSNQWPYHGTDPAPKSYIPWDYGAMKTYHELWDAFVPTRCGAGPHAATPWECMMANGSYATIESPIFFVEAQTDKVVMPLHNGLPAVWDATPKECANTVVGCPADVVDYMKSWSGHMIDSLQQVIVADTAGRNSKDGLFNPACLLHTGFATAGPFIDGVNYLQAVGDWIFKRNDGRHHRASKDSPRPHVFVDSCGVMCGGSCP